MVEAVVVEVGQSQLPSDQHQSETELQKTPCLQPPRATTTCTWHRSLYRVGSRLNRRGGLCFLGRGTQRGMLTGAADETWRVAILL